MSDRQHRLDPTPSVRRGLRSTSAPAPDAFLASDQNFFSEQDAEMWATRGAMNAGLAVFLYLDALVRGDAQRPVPHDRCAELAKP